MQSGPLNASLDMLFSTLESRLREFPNFRGSPSRESKKTSENKTRGTLGVHLVLRFLRGALDPCFFFRLAPLTSPKGRTAGLIKE